jgi:pyruvate kinase
MDYKIIATLGPASSKPETWQAMLAAGATGFRLNTSHLSLETLKIWLERIAEFSSRLEQAPAVALDLQGSKWRLGEFGACELAAGEMVEVVYALESNRPGIFPTPHLDFFKAVQSSNGEIVLNDAKVRLKVERISEEKITARVVLGGPLSAHKGLTFSQCDFRVESLSEKDQAILAQTRSYAFVQYAVSYLRDAEEMHAYRQAFGEHVYLIAKLERQPAVDQLESMADWADEAWVCRGDMGAELGLVGMAQKVLALSEILPRVKIPVIMAGQVLEHMAEHATPTRSEVCFMYESLVKGYKGFVLSDEAAVGRYPLESVQAAALFHL